MNQLLGTSDITLNILQKRNIYIYTGKTIGDNIWIVNHTMVSVTRKIKKKSHHGTYIQCQPKLHIARPKSDEI